MTTDLVSPLAQRGVQLSREQVYRLVAQTPERLNVYVLAALCDILECTPSDLIEPIVERHSGVKRAAGAASSADVRGVRPTRARIIRPAP